MRRSSKAEYQRLATVSSYLMESINFGGEQMARGTAYQLLLRIAEQQGHSEPRVMANAWMAGRDLMEVRRG